MTAIVDRVCACTTQDCSKKTFKEIMDWMRPRGPFTQTPAAQALLHRMDACSDALDARAGGTGSAVAVNLSGGDEPALPDGLSRDQLATVDAKIAEITSIADAVRASPDCAAAARAIQSHATGFVPLKAVMRAANPAHDPKIDTYFEQVQLPRAIGALNPILNRDCDTPEWSAALDAVDFLGLRTVH
jgi:hypothetical protein